jgi:uracil-DNA glycosylase family 4
MVKSKYVVIGQNPGFNECMQDEPFVGPAGKTFNNEIEKHGLKREAFYITNLVHCHTEKNRAPNKAELAACQSIVKMELMHLEPQLVITLGKFAFEAMCPGETYSTSLGVFKKSKFIATGVGTGKILDVFPIYHPSGMNLAIKERKDKFEQHISGLCKIIKHWENNGHNS